MLELRIPDVSIHTRDFGIDALAAIGTIQYDAIVADIRMPGIDGLQLLTRIRGLQPDTPTLLITGHGEQTLAARAVREGAYDFVQKPIEREAFVASLRKAIDEYRRRRSTHRL